jgi:hypothetical protein
MAAVIVWVTICARIRSDPIAAIFPLPLIRPIVYVATAAAN